MEKELMKTPQALDRIEAVFIILTLFGSDVRM
jgi:hypothetical protein